jgi:hypothetical protein
LAFGGQTTLSSELSISRRPKSRDYCLKDNGDTCQGSKYIIPTVQM